MRLDMNVCNYKFGFIATVNEITTGSIQNTNTPKLASILYCMGYDIGQHVLCNDDKDDIINAISSLANEHDVIIIVGGLGPTEDDLTCEAVASYVKRELVFSQDSWDRITQRYSSVVATEIPLNNKKQAYFPEGSYILKNMKGTADGCITKTSFDKYIITLPGPPIECYSMFENNLKSYICENFAVANREIHNWLLMGVSESKLSVLMKALADKYGESFGYRAEFPYIELKLHSKRSSVELKRLIDDVIEVIKVYNVGACIEAASSQLFRVVVDNSIAINVKLDCTHGYLNSQLFKHREFSDSNYVIDLITTGMDNMWVNSGFDYDDLKVTIQVKNKSNNTLNEYSFIGNIKIQQDLSRTLQYIYEWVNWKMLETIRKELKYG
jgi:molybdenum cofactor synthesis domain-containing protein